MQHHRKKHAEQPKVQQRMGGGGAGKGVVQGREIEADLLTQAMSELTQSFGEYRVIGGPQAIGGTEYQAVIIHAGGNASLVQAGGGDELSQFVQFHPQTSAGVLGPASHIIHVASWAGMDGFQ